MGGVLRVVTRCVSELFSRNDLVLKLKNLTLSSLKIAHYMKLSAFNFELPEELIAQHPEPNRDESRLMVLDREKRTIEHKQFKDVLDYFDEGDVLIMNNTKVFPARLYGNKEKTGARIEVFLLRELNRDSLLWDVLVDPARKIRIGNKLYFTEDDTLVAEVIDNTTSRGRTIRFLFDGSYEEFKEKITELGETPIPPYIKSQRDVVPEDEERYQTIYAKNEGAVAAPTAGLHFSRELLKRFEIKGVEFAELTLHVGLGTFRSVDVEDLTKHKMDSEQAIITEEVAEKVNKGKRNKRRVCAVGTTSMRAIESSVSTDGYLKPFNGWTNKFIFPPYDFSIANSMITNFHTPQSTLMMMVAAFADLDFVKEAYNEAVKEKYRFYSYGDAMLII
jgi:S-adenosylmethionine:tRNA ribosyltransferase-isomerase